MIQATTREIKKRSQIVSRIQTIENQQYSACEKNLFPYLKQAWKILEPGREFKQNWHHALISEYLEQALFPADPAQRIRRLIINMPPRYTKSLLVSVCFPTWAWIRDPSLRFLSTSYSQNLSTKHSVDRRTLIESDWYQHAWHNNFQLSSDQNVKTEFSNDKRGIQFATSMSSSATGKGGDIILVDDPHDTTRAASDVKRTADIEAFDQKFTTRLDNKETGIIIVVMQRLHEKDLTGHLLAQGDKWTHLCLPAEAPSRTTIIFPLSKRKIDRMEGAILHPEREDAKQIAEVKIDLGSAGYQAQYQQDPTPQKGGFFNRSWWKYYHELPKDILRTVQFVDCAEEPGITNDYTAIATWVETRTGYYLVDRFKERVTFPDLERSTINLFNRYKPEAIVIEKKSAGTQLIQNLSRNSTLPIIPYQPGKRSKEVRAAGAQPTVEAGNCYLPDDQAWVDEFVTQHEKFPNVEHDDLVDTTSMMVEYFKTGLKVEPRMRSL